MTSPRRRVDLDDLRINLNPKGRKQTKKYRPIVPLTDTLLPFVQKRDVKRFVNWHGAPIGDIKKGFKAVVRAAGLDHGAYPPGDRSWVRHAHGGSGAYAQTTGCMGDPGRPARRRRLGSVAGRWRIVKEAAGPPRQSGSSADVGDGDGGCRFRRGTFAAVGPPSAFPTDRPHGAARARARPRHASGRDAGRHRADARQRRRTIRTRSGRGAGDPAAAEADRRDRGRSKGLRGRLPRSLQARAHPAG